MKKGWILGCLLLTVILLSACQSKTLPATTQPVQAPGTDIYPAPLQGQTESASSSPVPQSTQTGPGGTYPGPNKGDEVPWDFAVTSINNGEVAKVVQTHAMQVYLYLNDGRILITIEPSMDEVLNVIKQCGDKCKSISVATE